MNKKIVVDVNISWGQITFKDSKDAMALFDLLQRATHIDNDYLQTDDNNSKCYYYESDRDISPSIRSMNICTEEEIASVREAAAEYKARKAAEKKEAEEAA